MEEFNKMDALKYLVKTGPEYTNEVDRSWYV